MRRQTRFGVRHMLITLLLLTLIPLAAVQAFSIYNRFDARFELELQSSEEFARAVGSSFANYLHNIWDSEGAIGAAIALGRLDQDEVRSLLEQQFHSHPTVLRFSWAAPDGTILYSSLPDLEGRSISFRDYFRRIEQGEEAVVSDLLTLQSNDRPGIVVARGIHRDGILVGVVTAAIDATRLGIPLDARRLGSASFGVIDRNAMIVYRSTDPDLPLSRRSIPNDPKRPGILALQGKVARTRRFDASVDGSVRMGAAVPIPGIGWAAFATTLVDEVLAPVYREAWQDAAVLLLISALSVAGAVLVSNRLLRPVRALQEAALAISNGGLTARIQPDGADELSDASRAFNQMAERVQAAEAILLARARQHAAVAAFGQRALGGADLQKLLDEVVAVVTDVIAVRFCAVLELQPDGASLVSRAGAGWKPGFLGRVIVPAGAKTLADYVLQRGVAVVVENHATESRFRLSPALEEHGINSSLAVPIHGRHGPVGILSVHSSRPHRFTEDEANVVAALANALGTVFQHERIRVREQTEHAVARILAESESLTAAIPKLVEAICQGLDWAAGLLWVPEEDQKRLRCVHCWNRSVSRLAAFISVASQSPVTRGRGLAGWVWESRELIWAANAVGHPQFLHADEAKAAGLHGAVCFPISNGPKVLGIMELFSQSVRLPDEDLMRTLESIGRQIGQFMEHRHADEERAVLLVREQAARAEAEDAQRRLGFLAEASALLAASLDYESTLENMVQLAVPRIADWSCVHVAGKDGTVRRVARASSDPNAPDWGAILEAPYRDDGSAPFGLHWVLRTGQPDLYPQIPRWLLESSAGRIGATPDLAGARLTCGMIVPLQAKGRTLGAMTFIMADSGRQYEPADLALAEEIAHRAALALDNANLYTESREAVRSRDVALGQIQALNAELERRVLERTAELEAAVKELETFSYSVSHDLRAPLRVIDGFSQALMEDCSAQLPADGEDYLQRIRAAAKRMGQLIDALLQLSRVSRSEMRWDPVDLTSLARTIAADLQGLEPERQSEVIVAEGLTAHGDERLLRIALENLLGNAWKFTARRSDARIEFGAQTRDGPTFYFVRDNGSGFDMRYVHKLFGAFQRLHSSGEFEGTGIGLATVQRIIRRHGGHIWAEGAVDRGATFYFTLTQE